MALTDHHNKAKTHCPRGHEYDEANTYVDKRGCRSCVICRRAATRNHWRRRNQGGQ